MIKGIAHLCIRVKDLEQTGKFYMDGLGLEKGFDFIRDGRVIGFYLKAGNGNYLEFFQTDNVPDGESPLAHICLEVDSIEATATRLSAAGYTVSEKKMGSDKAYQAWITDPDGVRIELHEYTPECSQRTGNPCIL
jgi:catechol 2,3-dioxygenase-like lactoylglutathione lyase family enzyme